MYHIKKSEDSWTIRNGDTGRNCKLTGLEMLAVTNEFPELGCQQVTSVYVEQIESLKQALITPGLSLKKMSDCIN